MYIIVNNYKINIIKANTFFKRFMGFMGKEKITYGILFPKTNSIHTFFMKQKIDVIAINNKNEIILKMRCLDKNKILTVRNKKRSTSILELPKNTSTYFNIGDTITLYK